MLRRILKPFGAILWPAADHDYSLQVGEWSAVTHIGLKEPTAELGQIHSMECCARGLGNIDLMRQSGVSFQHGSTICHLRLSHSECVWIHFGTTVVCASPYVDIVIDTLHALSSDLITWNTLVVKRLKLHESPNCG